MTPDSNVVFIDTDERVTDFVSGSSSHHNQATYYIGRKDAVDDVLAGTGNDSIEGYSGADNLNGGGGDDLIIGGAGNDLIEGGSGSDTSLYTGAYGDYDIEFVTDGSIVISDSNVDRDGADTLKSVEFARFSDRTVNLRPGQDVAFVIDTTGSMFDDIGAVKAQSAAILNGIFDPSRGLLNSRVAVVGYNDPATETYLSFTEQPDPDDRKSAAIGAINRITVGGGGDFPEAVNAGLLRALNGGAGTWRKEAAARRIILFGDAPPKDVELAGQVYRLARNLNVDVPTAPVTRAMAPGLFMTSFSVADASADSPADVVPVQIYTVVIGSDASTAAAFREIATESGGTVFTASNASTVVETLLTVLAAPIYSIAADETSVVEGSAGSRNVSFTVSRDVATGAAAVTLAALGTADAEDVSSIPVTVNFADGETSRTVTVAVLGDRLIEADETFGLRIVSVDQPSTIGVGSAVLTITDDDTSVPLTIFDTDESNTLTGGEFGDLIHGFGGDDTVFGLAGDDTLFGDVGNDSVDGGAGDDAVRGFFGRDTLRGGAGNDLVSGEQDADWVDGGSGNDTVEGGDGDDVLFGGEGNDSLDGGDGADLGFGGDGDDLVHGFSGRDTLDGGAGNDLLYGDLDDDVVSGGDGADTVTGFFGSDQLFGNAGDDLLLGEQDNDILTGGTGVDTLEGGIGNDVLYGDDGRMALRGDFAGDRLIGGEGDDILYQGDGLDTLTGGSGRDIFEFKFTNPLALVEGGLVPGYTEIIDFNASDDRLNFDAANLGVDQAGANFVNTSSGGPSTRVDSFYSGAAAGAAGESVVVLTDQGFASASAAATAVTGEQAGDLILYFNTTVGTASMLYVRGENDAVSIARFTDVASVSDLAGKGFTQDNFVFV
ncbi:hypothetical protein MPEAHAMD_3768 [Methylobacterium frigidaeris]|uniref:VWFA domain-containing protein n=2 Tax=Methylobacterium frigidaeris TaxID=2038277 RepID=A0AA37HDC5_9HYPH|nr:hypothetical protein MPEAHAMD_3768 [Methylobacterium frigidaeris]